MDNRKLMASFVIKSRISEFIKYVHENKITDKVFILENNKQSHIYIVTYNLNFNCDMSNLREVGVLNSLSIQRNKTTNTLYSINALNILLTNESMKTEKPKHEIKLNWDKYENSFLTTSDDELNIIKTKLHKFIKLNENFDISKLKL